MACKHTLTYYPPQQKEKLDPITGISSEGYSGKGFVQSAPAGK